MGGSSEEGSVGLRSVVLSAIFRFRSSYWMAYTIFLPLLKSARHSFWKLIERSMRTCFCLCLCGVKVVCSLSAGIELLENLLGLRGGMVELEEHFLDL